MLATSQERFFFSDSVFSCTFIFSHIHIYTCSLEPKLFRRRDQTDPHKLHECYSIHLSDKCLVNMVNLKLSGSKGRAIVHNVVSQCKLLPSSFPSFGKIDLVLIKPGLEKDSGCLHLSLRWPTWCGASMWAHHSQGIGLDCCWGESYV